MADVRDEAAQAQGLLSDEGKPMRRPSSFTGKEHVTKEQAEQHERDIENARAAMSEDGKKQQAGTLALTSSAPAGGVGFNVVASICAYAFCSISMVLANKAIATRKIEGAGDLSLSLVCIQNVVAVILCESFKAAKQITYADFDWDIARQWLPVNLYFTGMLVSSFVTFKYLSVPMVTISKNLTNIIIVFADWKYNNTPVTYGVMAAFAFMVLGAFFAGYSDIHFSSTGYFWMGVNCFTTAGYVLSMRRMTQSIKLSKFGMVFYNNLISTPIMLTLALFKGEFGVLYEAGMDLWTPAFTFINVYAGSVGFLLNLASLWCVGSTSATTYAVVGSFNKVPTAIVGWFLFQSPISPETVTYMTIAMIGSFIYSAAKLKKF
uniref:Sugar phosphate transporter domain-containing protein n=1 Tax=Phaeomonas parva TaxID=124430 RepID=A0A7S1XWK5_9STRA|mmetsp:Transcript_3994/g.11614  ORF Transcript_3994/g.11614 Transcript_3994/m.11614 type:complete len:377 (+) Transcript_3994:82-1212(+)|eukprot:CAMPEP_0118885324 /NCGR_PEP_ID=MMETSP1163-20130328/23846_1 /TAXON_ID=124430 /ORGANISM="Phaeomonas parva, Strain CCMP2877" /LENGTH=376 /DNA_ID=CAMNT_0006823317 /DNA_START=11 /DNA_END=1141 /DNA_ORIENTATION=+